MKTLPFVLSSLTVVGLTAGCASEAEPVDTGAARQTQTAMLSCTTPARAEEDASFAPRFELDAQIATAYRTGAELVELGSARVSAGRPSSHDQEVGAVAKDGAYRPHAASANRNRFNLPSLDATDESFDGIVHSVILPKTLGAADTTKTEDGTIFFRAIVASSTDSYHDGIISYFRMSCELRAGSASTGHDRLHCAAREHSDDAWGPSFALTSSVDASYKSGAELTALVHASASAAQDEPRQFASIAKDAAYRPRTDLNRNRFNFDLSATNDSFDGIVHGVILPKKLEAGTVSFKGWVASSTDSYHDGIISYFPMDCRLSH